MDMTGYQTTSQPFTYRGRDIILEDFENVYHIFALFLQAIFAIEN